MILFLIILVLIVAIIILTIRYIRINAQSVSREKFEAEAARQAAKMRYQDPIITCDYCGSKIDTTLHRTCPNCGANFDRDPEWVERHNLDLENINKKADAYAKNTILEAQKNSAKTKKLLKRCLIALGSIVGILIVLGLVISFLEPEHTFTTQSEELNRASYETYAPAAYAIDGDGVILDSSGVKVTVTGVFENQNDSAERDFKIGLRVENESGQPVSLSLSLAGVNSKAPESGYSFKYDWYKNHADILQYLPVYNLEDSEICEMIFSDIQLSGDDYELRAEVPKAVVKTSSAAAYSISLPDETEIYDNYRVKILGSRNDEGHYLLWIVNLSDMDYLVSSSDFRINGFSVDSSGLYRQIIPAHYLCKTHELFPYNQDTDTDTDSLTELSLDFICKEDPAENFSTGYLPLTF